MSLVGCRNRCGDTSAYVPIQGSGHGRTTAAGPAVGDRPIDTVSDRLSLGLMFTVVGLYLLVVVTVLVLYSTIGLVAYALFTNASSARGRALSAAALLLWVLMLLGGLAMISLRPV